MTLQASVNIYESELAIHLINSLNFLQDFISPNLSEVIAKSISLLTSIIEEDVAIKTTLRIFKKTSGDLLKAMLYLLFVQTPQKDQDLSTLISDFFDKNKRENNLSFSVKSFPFHNLGKIWKIYILITNEAFRKRKADQIWGGIDKIDEWWSEEENELFLICLKKLEKHHHWKSLILRSCLSADFFPFESLNLIKESKLFVLEFFQEKLKKAKLEAEVELEKRANKRKSLLIRIDALRKLEDWILTAETSTVLNFLIEGRISKKLINLEHSIVLGDDGGLYALMNTLSDVEKDFIMKEESLSYIYFKSITKEIIDMDEKNDHKFYRAFIGKGSFGKIRFALVLTNNEFNEKGETTMMPGQIICCKKTRNLKKLSLLEMIEHSWKDYSSGEISKLIYSPETYDLMIPYYSGKYNDMIHQKGYTFQKFLGIFDGAKAFKDGGLCFNQWNDQKTYFIDILTATIELLNSGLAMTDMKLQNTLYDPVNKKGLLIDLSGVVKKCNKEALGKCRIKDIQEFTKRYTAPEIKNNLQNPNYEVDLCKALSFSLGVLLESAMNLKKTVSMCPDIPSLQSLIKNLTEINPLERISVEEALNRIQEIGPKLQDFMDLSSLLIEIKKKLTMDPEQLGLKANIKQIMQRWIKLKVSKEDPFRFEVVERRDLDKEFSLFIENKAKEEQILLLLGNPGSGKSSFLQIKFIEEIEKWKTGNAIPFYIDLSTDNDLLEKWRLLQIKIGDKGNKWPFSLFAGSSQHPIILFMDSFDEAFIKMNYVNLFFQNIGKNPNAKFVIACRYEFIQDEEQIQQLFTIKSNFSRVNKLYICNLDSSFRIENYFENQWSTSLNYQLTQIDLATMKNDLIKSNNFKEIFTSCYIVTLFLEVLPELNLNNISLFVIYEKYVQTSLKREIDKITKVEKGNLMKEFVISDMDFYDFFNDVSIKFAKTLHREGVVKIDYFRGKDFFDFLNYNPNKSFKHQNIALIAKVLNLNFYLKSSLEEENFLLSFTHQSIQTYLIVKAIILEITEKKAEILSFRSIIKDVSLIEWLIEEILTNPDLIENLIEILYTTRRPDGNFDKNTQYLASNVITILVWANVSFADQDLSYMSFVGADLRNGYFPQCNFFKTDFSNARIDNCNFENALFISNNLKDVQFGEISGLNICCDEYVNQIIFSKDGRFFVIACRNKVVICDYQPLNELKSILFQSIQIDLSIDSTFLAGISPKGVIKVWNTLNWECKSLKPLKPEKNKKKSCFSICSKNEKKEDKPPHFIAFSPEKPSILAHASEVSVALWNCQNKHLVKIIRSPFSIEGMMFYPNGQQIAISGYENGSCSIQLIDIETSICQKKFMNANPTVCFSKNGKFLATGNKIFEVETAKFMTCLDFSDNCYNSLFSIDGDYVLTEGKSKLQLWTTEMGNLVKTFIFTEGNFQENMRVDAFTPDNKYLVTRLKEPTSEDFKVLIIEKQKNLKKLPLLGEIQEVSISPNNQFFANKSSQGLNIWKTDTGALFKKFEQVSPEESTNVKSKELICPVPQKFLRVSHNGKFLVGGTSVEILLYDLESDKQTWINQNMYNSIFKAGRFLQLCFSPEDNFLFCGSYVGIITILELPSFKIRKSFELELKFYKKYYKLDNSDYLRFDTLSFSHDSLWVAGYLEKETSIFIWNLNTGKLWKKIDPNNFYSNSA